MIKIKYLVAIVLAATGVVASAADTFPTRPVRVIITFPPGSATDIIGRVLTTKLTEFWGQTAVADNRGGAGGVLGSQVVAQASPDGYTLLVNSNAQAVNPSIYAKLPYDTLKDFTNIAPIVSAPNVLITSPSNKIKTVQEVIQEAKAQPGKVNFASAGVGSGTHLTLEKFKMMAHLEYNHIPYKGTGEAIIDILAGRVEYYFVPISAGIGYIKDNKVRAIAVSSIKRNSQVPNVPTVAEGGVKDFDSGLWFGLWGPGHMPAPLVDKIAKDVDRALSSKDVIDRMTALAAVPMHMKPAEFTNYVKSEIADTAKVVKAAGIKPQ
ncbi:MAG TPA: tripartite tricarboxylate transporter substrate binding protein [Burkholderiales bacterium]|nr:tripartite tricarboxylate transporter substrate binding protein [Burkholderiales bacterium]